MSFVVYIVLRYCKYIATEIKIYGIPQGRLEESDPNPPQIRNHRVLIWQQRPIHFEICYVPFANANAILLRITSAAAI